MTSPTLRLTTLLVGAALAGACNDSHTDNFEGTVMAASPRFEVAVAAAPDRASALVAAPRPNRYLLDADTGNEIDDLYAIAYALGETDSGAELAAISSAQWFHAYSGDSTAHESQRLNEELLALAGKTGQVEAVPGADSAMGAPWGGYAPRDSPAARRIVEEVDALPPGERLAVICLGATTNVASALALAPRIKARLAVWLLGYRYDADLRVWDKDEFNVRRDLNAANYLLNAEGLELHAMPISVAVDYTWDRDPTFARLAGAGDTGDYLAKRWETHATGDRRRTMWDVALLQAYLDPELATESAATTPPENSPRRVWVYDSVDTAAMSAAYWRVLRAHPLD